jgi:hypothetical protein
MIAIMSDEYSKYYTESANSILEKMWQATVEFQENLPQEKAEKKLKFGNLSCLIESFQFLKANRNTVGVKIVNNYFCHIKFLQQHLDITV